VTSSDWRASAAYLYVLHLSAPALAWEYVRRNPEYRSDWGKFGAHPEPAVTQRWGLEFLWDPELDARDAQPIWLPSPSAQLRISKNDERSQEHAFSLWNLPGRKRLLLSGIGILLFMQLEPDTSLNLALNTDLHTGCAFTFGISPHADPAGAADAVSRLIPLMRRPCASKPSTAMRRPPQKALRHWRYLQALDGEAAGATHREIAIAVFGEQDVWQRWTSDNSEIRAQVRYILKSARALMINGYRELLTGVAKSRQ